VANITISTILCASSLFTSVIFCNDSFIFKLRFKGFLQLVSMHAWSTRTHQDQTVSEMSCKGVASQKAVVWPLGRRRKQDKENVRQILTHSCQGNTDTSSG